MFVVSVTSVRVCICSQVLLLMKLNRQQPDVAICCKGGEDTTEGVVCQVIRAALTRVTCKPTGLKMQYIQQVSFYFCCIDYIKKAKNFK